MPAIATLEELKAKLDTGTDSVTELDWNDTFRYSLGLTYTPSPHWRFRTGVAYDETTLPDSASINPHVPDNDRILASLGLANIR